MLLLRERAKFSPARRKVKFAAGIAKTMSRTNFGLTTPPVEIAAVRSKNEFLEVPLIYMEFIEPDWCIKGHIGYILEGQIDISVGGKVVMVAKCELVLNALKMGEEKIL